MSKEEKKKTSFSSLCAFGRTLCQQSLCVIHDTVSCFSSTMYHIHLPHAGVRPPTARKKKNQFKFLKLFHSRIPNGPDLQLTAV